MEIMPVFPGSQRGKKTMTFFLQGGATQHINFQAGQDYNQLQF